MTDFVERKAYYAEAPVALIIGCGDLGMGCARALGQRHPLLIVDVDGDRLDRAVEMLRNEGHTVSGHKCDITDPQQTKALGAALSKGPGVRVLAHVAAVGPRIKDWRRMMAINLIGPHLVAQAAHPSMVRGAAAILVSSLGGYMCAPDQRRDAVLDEPLKPGFFDAMLEVLGGVEPTLPETYNYSKRALIRLAEKLAIAWGKDEVRVLSLSPGMLHTSMGRLDGALTPGRNEKVVQIPLGRQGTIVEAAAVLAFLASDAASFVNGIDVPVDGGHRAVNTANGRLYGGKQPG
ncbi:MAG: SDR family oxidoreductase [Rhodospirillaceae bacterium]|nr:MAG: SDR family oxidoreductase [Rhodospirillaceae bacterium]